jgi:hypothetical protein
VHKLWESPPSHVTSDALPPPRPEERDAVSDLKTAAPSVGGILLAQGLVSEEQLEEAQVAQQRTGKPVGQVLVEWGAITRLELASALAEQWSYAGSTPLRRPGEPRLEEVEAELSEAQAELHSAEPIAAAPPPPPAPDPQTVARVDAVETAVRELRDARDREDDATIAQFREAIVDLARRVGASEPLLAELSAKADQAQASEERLREVAQAVDESLGRLGSVETGMAEAGARLDEVANRIGQSLADLERRFDIGAGELTELARRTERAADSGTLHEIQARLDALDARPAGDPELHETVQRLAARLEIAPDAASVTELRGALEALGARVAAADDLAVRVDELARLVQRLPDGMGAVGTDVSQAAVIELNSRIDQLSHRADESLAAATAAQAAAVEELRGSLHELAARPDPAVALGERLEHLGARVEAIAARDDSEILDELRRRLHELAARPAGDPALAERVTGLSGRLDEVAGRLDGLVAARPEGPDESVIEELRAAVHELRARPAADPELVDRLQAVSARVDVLSDVVKDAPEPGIDPHAVEELRAALAGAESTAAQRLEELAARLGRVEQAAAASPSAPADGGAVSEHIERATASWAATQETLAGRIDQLELRQREAAESATARSAISEGTPVPGVATGAGLEQEFDRLLMAIERLSLRIGEHDRALGELMRGGASAQRVSELAGRIAELELRGGGGGGGVVGGGGGGEAIGGGALLAVAGRLEEVENARKADREKLFTQIERMASALDWRLQRLEAAAGTANGTPAS